ncbi:hypothetical protein VTI74DRAFT_9984 [Chaetomium olivicolor]
MGLDSDSPAPITRPPHSGRKGSKKVRTGCITCKIRKVKCDEAKPFCMRCTKTGRRCDGYLDTKTMGQRRRRSAGPLVTAAGDPPRPMALFYDWASSDERRAFHFFQHITAPCLSGDLDSAFWSVLVLQICQSEPAVRHAVLAVSSLHESMVQAAMVPSYRSAKDGSSFALYQYNRAIACLLDQMRTVDARPLVPLLTCVLFVCIELMQSKDKESLLHLEQGRQILSAVGQKTSTQNPETDLIKKHLVPIYTRLNLTSLMFGCESAEIPAPLKTLTEIPMVFETLDDVRYALYDFMDECLRFAQKSHVAKIEEIPPEQMRTFEREQDYLLRKLAKFKVAFSLYRCARRGDAPPGSIALIQIHVHTTFIWISTALSRQETVFDDYVETFSAIIPLAIEFVESLTPSPTSQEQHPGRQSSGPTPTAPGARRFSTVFTFEMHIIAPLYFVAAKCRHPMIRRTALNLLRRNPARRENLWRADVMAAIAERTMRVEEKHLRQAHPNGQPQSQPSSPPELYLNPSVLGHSAWTSTLSQPPFPDIFCPGDLGTPTRALTQTPFVNFDAAQVPIPSSCSTSSATSSAEVATTDDLAGQMPIDPTLFYDPTEELTAHSFSMTPSIASSLDDLGGPAAPTTPYLGASTEAQPGPWRGLSSQALPGIEFEPPTPLDDDPFTVPLPSHPQLRSHSRSHSRQQSHSQGPSSVGSQGSPPVQPTGTDNRQTPGTSTFQQAPQMATGLGTGLGLGRMSPTTGKRSVDSPFDVPERFRVHESIIGPQKEDGTSWVMLFRKLGGLHAEWDVLTEHVAVS